MRIPILPSRGSLRWSKVRTVAAFELLGTIQRKGYLIATFGMPVILLLYGLLIAIPGYFAARKQAEVKVMGLVDQAGVIDPERPLARPLDELPEAARRALERLAESNPAARFALEGTVAFRLVADEETARSAVMAGEAKGYYRIPPDYLETGKVEVYRRGGNPLESVGANEQLRRLLLDQLLARNVSETVSKRVRSPIADTERFQLEDDGVVTEYNPVRQIVSLAVPAGVAVFLFVSLMMTSGYLVQGTAEEKENRVVEVLLASTNPEEMLLGKLLGLGGAGLFQTLVWFSMLLIGAVVFAGVLAGLGVGLPWTVLGWGALYFVAAYLFMGSLMLATGSLGGNVKESQQWSAIWTVLSVVPFMFSSVLITEPNGVLARVLTWIPFSAPLTVLLRLAIEPAGVALWELAGSLAVLVLATWLALQAGARLFRVGLLLTGSRPKLREILRQARLG